MNLTHERSNLTTNKKRNKKERGSKMKIIEGKENQFSIYSKVNITMNKLLTYRATSLKSKLYRIIKTNII